jgi:L-lactate dehydrogenase complex protein LldE
VQASLFVTCLVDVFFPDAAADAVRLLRSLDVEVDFPPDQTCCGQPAFNAGRKDPAREMAHHTRAVFRNSRNVVIPSGSCATMLRRFYPGLLTDGHGAASASEVWGGVRVWELAEFLVHALEVRTLGDGLRGLRIAYHHGCHALRELDLRDEAVGLLEASGGHVVPWEAAEECCGFGGLFSIKLPEVSVAMADRKLDTLSSTQADVLTSADGGCLLQLAGRMAMRGVNVPIVPLATLLWRARSSRGRDEAAAGTVHGARSPTGAHGDA